MLRLVFVLVLTDAAAWGAGAQDAGVPGQGFHDWRDALIQARYTIGSIVAAEARPGAASPPSVSVSVAEAAADAEEAAKLVHARWLLISGARERISVLPGPPASNTSHPAAVRRLEAARAALRRAARRRAAAASAAAAAQAAAAAAEHAAAVIGEATSSYVDSQQQEQDSEPALQQPPADSQQQQQFTATTAAAALKPGSPALTASPHAAAGDTQPSLENATANAELTARLAAVEGAMSAFVRRTPGGQLAVNGRPWLLAALDVPTALADAAGGPQRRARVLHALDWGTRHGYNVLRLRAFADGGDPTVGSAVARAWSPALRGGGQGARGPGREPYDGGLSLQPAPGVLDAHALRSGLDWLLHVCGLRGVRLLLILTNGGRGGGGMAATTHWVDPALTVTDFYTNDTVKSVFLDYVAALLAHPSSTSGLPLRHDPLIAGWQLAEAPAHPGHKGSQQLLAWLRQVGGFIRERAPHQLVLTGLEGAFGASSPHLMQYNPRAQLFEAVSRTPHAAAPECGGGDFWLHNQPPEVDITTAAVTPDAWMACDVPCKLQWARSWIRSHLRDAVRLQKPLLLAPIAALRPHAWRAALLGLVRDEVARALEHGHPIAGFVVAGFSHPDQPDVSGWAIYDNGSSVAAARPLLEDVTQQSVIADVAWQRWSLHADHISCTTDAARGVQPGDVLRPGGWTEGWPAVLDAVAALGDVVKRQAHGKRT